MRDSFVRTVGKLAAEDRNVVVVTGDLGFGVLTDFARSYPGQYINAGVAEQNMTALAVGLALEGKHVFTYSIANFPTLRCLEQIRNDACYHGANVKIVAVGGGFAYGSLGISHHATEDLAIMRSLPRMTVLAPGDPLEAEAATIAAYETPGTCYLRLGRGGEKNVHTSVPRITVGRAQAILPGEDVALLSTGGILAVAAEARELLLRQGVVASLYSAVTLKPFDEGLIGRLLAASQRLIVTIEEHTVTGGLGGAVAEIMAGSANRKTRLLRCGLEAGFSSTVGDQAYLRDRYGLSATHLAAKVLQSLRAE